MRKLIFAVVFMVMSLSALNSTAQTSNDEAYKKELEQYMLLTGSDASFDVVLKQMFQLLEMNSAGSDKNVLAKLKKEIQAQAMGQLVNMLLPVYQKNISLEDLKKINEFYQTPAGKRIAAVQPQIMAESMQVGQEWGLSLQRLIENALK